MTSLRIPRERERGLVNILKLSEASIDELISALKEVKPTSNLRKQSKDVASKVHTIPSDEVDNIISTLISLHSASESLDSDLSEMVENVCKVIEQSNFEQLKFSGEDRNVFKERLLTLLNVEAVSIYSKVINILREQNNVFCNARILTDIRPVFGAKLETPPLAAFVVHTLRISYHQEDTVKEFYVAMDSNDIQELREVLNRDSLKADNLRKVIEAAKVPQFDI